MEKDYHEERMNEILKRSNTDNVNILAYISGFMGNNEMFQEAFESAIMNGIFLNDEM